jgi:adenylosuccinate lyase
MGLTFARFYAEMSRNRARLVNAAGRSGTGAISGAVGTFANIDPAVEEHVCKKLGLTPEPISTQVIPRDRHAMFFATLGVIASSIENVAIEIRHMQRTEVLEAEEFFSPGQKGSSAMPHKRNPVLTENLTGLARLVRMAVVPALENVALWHERDISHSSVERAIGPDATITLDFALHRLAGVVEKLVIYPENMLKNLNKFKGPDHVAARASGPDPGRCFPRGQLSPGAAQRDEGLGKGRRLQDRASGRPRSHRRLVACRNRGKVRPWLSHQACRHDLRPGLRGLIAPRDVMTQP